MCKRARVSHVLATNMKTARTRFYFSLSVVLFFAYAIDRASKYLALHHLVEPRVFIANALEIAFVQNPDYFFYFSLPRVLMVTIILALMIVVVWFAMQEYETNHDWHVAALLLILIGAFSNVFDRIQFGFVIDFIRVPFWSVFNFADMYIVGGAVVLMWKLMKKKERSV